MSDPPCLLLGQHQRQGSNSDILRDASTAGLRPEQGRPLEVRQKQVMARGASLWCNEVTFFVGAAPGLRSQSYFGGLGSSQDEPTSPKQPWLRRLNRGKMPLPQKTSNG